jgi:ABC-type antimicrobial peptide transport system permease subunit
MTGAVVSAWAVRGIESQLYGVRAHDAGVWSEVALIVVGVSVVAIVIPAWRVANTDPVLALKVE